MADQENCARVTRLSKKRAAEAVALGESQQPPANKKRVVLGEIKNLSNVVANQVQKVGSEPRKPRCKSKKFKKAVTTTTVTEKIDEEINVKSDDPQMCAAYVSDIYEYLHNME
ncbi:unnamed protein product, partial [Ilex paraguariensis]